MTKLLVFNRKTNQCLRIVQDGETKEKLFDFFVDNLPALGFTRFIADDADSFKYMMADTDLKYEEIETVTV